MIELKNITIDDKELFDRYFTMTQYGISDMNFTNLFMWHEPYAIKYAVIDNFLCIFARYLQNDPFVLMPLGEGDLAPVFDKLNKYFTEQGYPFVIKAITEDVKTQLTTQFPGKFCFKANRDGYDYVYLSSDLINLKGSKYHSKRNHINKFKALNKYTYEAMSAENINECIEAAIRWCEIHNCEDDPSLQQEKNAILLALHNFDKLKFKGGIIKLDRGIVAFTFGELLTDNMAVIHVEKANPDIQGSYTMINQMFCEREWSHIKYINREEDMGIPGLRKAKLSYKPAMLMKKYTAKLKKQ